MGLFDLQSRRADDHTVSWGNVWSLPHVLDDGSHQLARCCCAHGGHQAGRTERNTPNGALWRSAPRGCEAR